MELRCRLESQQGAVRAGEGCGPALVQGLTSDAPGLAVRRCRSQLLPLQAEHCLECTIGCPLDAHQALEWRSGLWGALGQLPGRPAWAMWWLALLLLLLVLLLLCLLLLLAAALLLLAK